MLELVFYGRAAVQMFPPGDQTPPRIKGGGSPEGEEEEEEGGDQEKKISYRAAGDRITVTFGRQPLFHLCHLKKIQNRSKRTDFSFDPRKQKLLFQRIRHLILIHSKSLLFLFITISALVFQSCKIFPSCCRLVFSLLPCKAAGSLRLQV